MYIDSHAHVNFNAFKDDGTEVIKRALENATWMINVGSQYSTSVRAVKIANQYEEGIWAAIGLHPIHLWERNLQPEEEKGSFKTAGEKFEYDKYLDLARDPKVVAIGEVGLDYHHFKEGDDEKKLKKIQKETLVEFIKLANEVGKPLVLHCWSAYEDLYDILKNHPAIKRGVIHSFIGSWKTAQKFLELGYLFGFNGIATYSQSYDRVIGELPTDKILIETDCPYLTPLDINTNTTNVEARRKQKEERNEPLNVKLVAEKIAKVRNISLEEVKEATFENAVKLFELKYTKGNK